MQVQNNQFRLLSFRSSRPRVRSPHGNHGRGHREGTQISVQEDHGPETSHHYYHTTSRTSPVPPSLRSSPKIFNPRFSFQDRGRRSNVFQARFSFTSSLMRPQRASMAKSWVGWEWSCKHLVKTNFDHQTLAPARAFSRESPKKTSEKRVSQARFRIERG